MSLAAWSWELAGELLVLPPDPPQDSLSPVQPGAGLEPLPLASLLERVEAVHRGFLLPELMPALALALLQRGERPLERELIRQAADAARSAWAGPTVTYVVNRNLNVSNHCSKHCSFCAFRRDPGKPGAYWLERDELIARAREAQAAGATELCLQGGLNAAARLRGSLTAYAEQLLRDLHQAAPGIHLHAFSPQELLFFAEGDGIPLAEVIGRLQAAGLGSVPGTAAEVLSDRVRRVLCPEKLSARAWCAVILEVHRAGLASTATLMAGHIEAPADRAAHLLTLLALQRHARSQGWRGFSEFVLLPFVGQAAPAPLRQRVGRDQPELEAMLLLTAQARLILGPLFTNHQPSWVKLTLAGAGQALRWGCNDLGGTLMEEHITTMAGAQGGTSQSPQALEAAARRLDRPVRQRTTLYDMAQPVPA